MTAGRCPRCAEQSRRVRREFLNLTLLSSIAVALFLVTRAAADGMRDVRQEAAQKWNAQGQRLLAGGKPEQAAGAFRQARLNNPDNRTFALALSQALAAAGHTEEAERVLTELRDTAIEDAEINLQIARLSASTGDVSGAVRFYHNALYGVWPEHPTESLYAVRMELVRFLLAHHQRDAAVSELLIASSGLTGDAGSRIEIGNALLQAGDAARASTEFTRAVQLEPRNAQAVEGAGLAAYQQGDYSRAVRMLRQAVAQNASLPAASDALSVVELILQRDPLATGLRSDERLRRLRLDLDDATTRLDQCTRQAPAGVGSLQAAAFGAEQQALGPLDAAHLQDDPQLVERGVDLVGRIEEAARSACGPGSSLDRALARIGRLPTGDRK